MTVLEGDNGDRRARRLPDYAAKVEDWQTPGPSEGYIKRDFNLQDE